MDVERAVLKKWNELFEKYELELVPKTSWKDLCMLEINRNLTKIPDKTKVRAK